MSENNQFNNDEQDFNQIKVPVTANDRGIEILAQAVRQDALINQSKENLDNLKKMTRITTLLAIAFVLCLIVLGVVVYMFTQMPKNRVINTVNNATICEALPQDNANYSPQTIAMFASEAVLALHSMNFLNADEQLNYVLQNYFTQDGRIAISSVLAQNNMVNDIKSSASIMKARLVSSPSVIESTDTYWTIQFEMIVGIYGADPKPKQEYKRTVIVRVAPTLKNAVNARGLGVEKLEVKSE